MHCCQIVFFESLRKYSGIHFKAPNKIHINVIENGKIHTRFKSRYIYYHLNAVWWHLYFIYILYNYNCSSSNEGSRQVKLTRTT